MWWLIILFIVLVAVIFAIINIKSLKKSFGSGSTTTEIDTVNKIDTTTEIDTVNDIDTVNKIDTTSLLGPLDCTTNGLEAARTYYDNAWEGVQIMDPNII